MSTYWGYHLMLDCSNLNPNAIRSKEVIKTFLKRLIWKIDMVPFGEPSVEYFETHDPDKSGISYVQMIETSNLTGHFVDLNNTAYLDIFSCKEFKNEDVVELVKQFFGTDDTKIRINFLTRHAN